MEKELAECLEAIEQGRLTIEQCQRRYPKQWEQLRRLLPLASTLRQAPRVSPSLTFRRHARQRLIAKLPPHQQAQRFPLELPGLSNLFKVPNLQFLKPSLHLLVIMITVIALGSVVGAAYASGDTLPGDALHPVKIGVENLRLLFTFDSANETLLRLDFAQRRIGEMKSLAQKGRYDDLQLASVQYQSLLLDMNESLREMALDGDNNTQEIGKLVEETLFYDTIILTGLRENLPTDTKGYIEVAIGASKSGNSIARQWVELLTTSPSSIPTQLPSFTQASKDIAIPLPTNIACWPNDLPSDPPDGIPLCDEYQTPVPLPADLVLFCWPSQIPFGPPQNIPICGEGQEPIPMPDNLGLICWPRQVSRNPPADLPLCQEGQLPVPLPSNHNLSCWPSNIPFNAPAGLPPCKDGLYPTPLPKELPCWPPELSPNPPPGLTLCEPGASILPPIKRPNLVGTQGGRVRDLVDDIVSHLASEYCWPTRLQQDPPFGMPLCQPE